MKVSWSAIAERQFIVAIRHIAADNPSAAWRVHDEIRDQAARLAGFPQLGRIGRLKGTRELVISRTPYVVIYRVAPENVTIMRVLHGAQRWPPLGCGLDIAGVGLAPSHKGQDRRG